MFEGFDRRQVDVGDVTIHCVVAGEGPPVLLLHGYPQSLAMWARVAPLLAERFSVVCADLRGYGDSSKPHDDSADHSTYSFRAMAGDHVANLLTREVQSFEQLHPRSRDLAHAARESLLAGVPMPWMTRWPGSFPSRRRERRRELWVHAFAH